MDQAQIARESVQKLRDLGRIDGPEAEALAHLVITAAEWVDADQEGNAALLREYRQAWRELREVTSRDDADDPYAKLLEELSSAGPAGSSEVRDSPPA